jgi:hypothetical protein
LLGPSLWELLFSSIFSLAGDGIGGSDGVC